MKTTLSNFRGLETARSIYEAAPNRAVEMSNLININGSNVKRNGLIPIADFNNSQIRGMWQFTEGGTKVFIIHAGTKIYRVVEGINISTTLKTEVALPIDSRVVDSRSYGIEHNGVLHIFCGDYLLYARKGNDYVLSRAADNEDMTYIPTTTISIDSVGAAEQMRSNFEEVNLLTKWRINTLQGNEPTAPDNADNKAFYLDNSIDAGTVITITIYKPDSAVVVYKCEALSDDIKFGEIKKGFVDRPLGKLCFSTVADVNIGRSDNAYIEVKYAHSTNMERREKILRSKIGTQFGLNGNNDRLFVANGNTDHYSGANDYTYFPENNYTVFGSSTSSIIGYSRINDGTLGVHKSYGDSSGIYYRNYSTINLADSNTGTSAIETIFPITAGAVGQWCLSGATCRSLEGDTLYLSDNGVYGITLGNSMVVNERYAKERSENISNLLASIVAKSNACAEVIDGRYHLYIDKQCFIADARYKYSKEQSKDDTFSYEWWRHEYPFAITTSLLSEERKLYLGATALYIEQYERYDIIPCGTTTTVYNSNGDTTVYTDDKMMKYLFGDNQELGASVKIMMYGEKASSEQNGKGEDWRHRVFKAIWCTANSFKVILRADTDKLYAEDFYIAKVIPVSANYVTPMLDLGDNVRYKTIHGVGAVVDNSEINDLTISCISKDSEDSVRILQGGHFDFNKIDFNFISFGSPRFSTLSINKFKRRNINYIKFKFSSNNNCQCVVNNMTIEYDYTRKLTRGGNY